MAHPGIYQIGSFKEKAGHPYSGINPAKSASVEETATGLVLPIICEAVVPICKPVFPWERLVHVLLGQHLLARCIQASPCLHAKDSKTWLLHSRLQAP